MSNPPYFYEEDKEKFIKRRQIAMNTVRNSYNFPSSNNNKAPKKILACPIADYRNKSGKLYEHLVKRRADRGFANIS